ncbi:hypothetical protein KC19_6G093900 [Ceratodon purpureus]|uniref:Uncharacterized protein n=1 Tax=Ceratodon purpureus TaxID=3225 RepID=A0A8T0HG77_CERPU|nr:hypothetical protein KC19_6G093900 [Ceratodon purpureus]
MAASPCNAGGCAALLRRRLPFFDPNPQHRQHDPVAHPRGVSLSGASEEKLYPTSPSNSSRPTLSSPLTPLALINPHPGNPHPPTSTASSTPSGPASSRNPLNTPPALHLNPRCLLSSACHLPIHAVIPISKSRFPTSQLGIVLSRTCRSTGIRSAVCQRTHSTPSIAFALDDTKGTPAACMDADEQVRPRKEQRSASACASSTLPSSLAFIHKSDSALRGAPERTPPHLPSSKPCENRMSGSYSET